MPTSWLPLVTLLMPSSRSRISAISDAFSMSMRRNRPRPVVGSAGKHEVARHAHQRQRARSPDRRWRCRARGHPSGCGNEPRLPSTTHLAAGRVLDPGQHLDDGRLAGAVLAEKADDLAGTEREREVLDRGHAEEALGDVAQFDDRRAPVMRYSRPIAIRRSRWLARTARRSRSPMKNSVRSAFQPRKNTPSETMP